MSSPAAQSLGSLLRYLPYQKFNKVQEAVIPALFTNDSNCLIAAPTGSGKTVLLEVAMLRLFRQRLLNSAGNDSESGQAHGCIADTQGERLPRNIKYKAVYICPIKALANEKYQHWCTQFSPLSVVMETGDQMQQRELRHKSAADDGNTSEGAMTSAFIAAVEDMSSVSQADILITTPERWDSITRRWNEKEVMTIVNSVGLLLLDEVHTVQEERGTAMEAIVSRVKAIQAAVAHDAVNCAATRIVAISGTLPNICDMAEWLEVSPEMSFAFSAADRPVPLTVKVIGYAYDSANPFAFHRFLSFKLFSLVQQFSEGMPTLVFCASRKEVTSTALQLVEDIRGTAERRGQLAQLQPSVEANRLAQKASDRQLRGCLLSGVGFHHAAMAVHDRLLVERMFREQYIAVVCSTTTLALGVNLPAHLVVIKGTTFFASGQYQDVSVSEVMQMCGRAGRPGLDTHGVALVLTTQRKAHLYETLRNGAVTLTCVESHLHRHMIEHVNAEVALRTIQSFHSALEWAKTTFFWIRLRKCPRHYGLEFVDKAEEDEFSAEAFVEALMERVLRVLAEEGCISIRQATKSFATHVPPLLRSELEDAVEHSDSFPSDGVLGGIQQPGVVFESTRLGRAMSRMYILFDTVCILNSALTNRGVLKCNQLKQQPSDDAATMETFAEHTEVKKDGEDGCTTEVNEHESGNPEQKKSSLNPNSTPAQFNLQETLQLLCQCQELVEVRLRQGDRGPLNEINRAVRFPLQNGRRGGREVREEWHKAYLLIQASVGLLPITEVSLRNDAARLWSVVPRVSRFLEEYAWAQTSSYSLACCTNLLARCMERRVWPDGPVLRQLPHVSDAVAKSLLQGGYRSFESLRNVDARQLEVLCSRLPPFGNQVLENVRSLPQLEVKLSIDMAGNTTSQAPKSLAGSKGVGTVRVFLSHFSQSWLNAKPGSDACSEAVSSDLKEAQNADTSKRQGVKSALTESAMRDGRVLLVVGDPAVDVILLKRFVPLYRIVSSGATSLQVTSQSLAWHRYSGNARAAVVEQTAGKTEVACFTFTIPTSRSRRSSVRTEKHKIEARCFLLHMVGLDAVTQVSAEALEAAVTAASTPSAVVSSTAAMTVTEPPPSSESNDGEAKEKQQEKGNDAVNVEQRMASAQIAAEARNSFNALLADMTYVASDCKRTRKLPASKAQKRSRSEATAEAVDTTAVASASKLNVTPLEGKTALQNKAEFCEGDAVTVLTTEAAALSVAEVDTPAAAIITKTCSPLRGSEEKGDRSSPPPSRQRRANSSQRYQQSPAHTPVHLHEESEAGSDTVHYENELQAGQATFWSPTLTNVRNAGVTVRLPCCTSPPATRPPTHLQDRPSLRNSFPDVHDGSARSFGSRDVGGWRFPEAETTLQRNCPPHLAYQGIHSSRAPPWQFIPTNTAPPTNKPDVCSPSTSERSITRPNLSFGFPSNPYKVVGHRGYENIGTPYRASVEPRGFSSEPSERNAFLPEMSSYPWRGVPWIPAGWPPHPYSHGSSTEWLFIDGPSAPCHFQSEMRFASSNPGVSSLPSLGNYYPQSTPQPTYNGWTRPIGNAQWPLEYTQSMSPTAPSIPVPQARNWQNNPPHAPYAPSNAASDEFSVPRQRSLANVQLHQPQPHFLRQAAEQARSFPFETRGVTSTAQQITRNASRAVPMRPAAAPSAGKNTFIPQVRRSTMIPQSWWQ